MAELVRDLVAWLIHWLILWAIAGLALLEFIHSEIPAE